jgi:hypothetical protein
VEECRCFVFFRGDAPEKLESLASNCKQQCRCEYLVEVDIKLVDILRQNRCSRSNVFTMIDEPGFNVLCRVVADYDVNECSFRNLVARTWNRVVDERE